MSRVVFALAAAGIAFAVAAGTCAWLLRQYMPGTEPQGLYMDADILLKLVMMLIVLLLLAILGLGLAGVFSPADRFAVPLSILAGASAALGLLGAGYGWLMVQQVVARIGEVAFDIVAHSYAEAALVASMGLFGAVVALGLRTMAEFRQ
ncbi:hypothetical protein [Brevundimonas lenta]|uniref:Small-conductance mechanosensitive channel n=1 Tax=Brevundimonas lenta TaxID=424796 RepID=A0A7W6NQC5_9CAUL|nr:hypothetical protein [Brevundimonas lenta]MBB4084375.1 small-conductance mechanosensitive channel [Brevundimonas lenta]